MISLITSNSAKGKNEQKKHRKLLQVESCFSSFFVTGYIVGSFSYSLHKRNCALASFLPVFDHLFDPLCYRFSFCSSALGRWRAVQKSKARRINNFYMWSTMLRRGSCVPLFNTLFPFSLSLFLALTSNTVQGCPPFETVLLLLVEQMPPQKVVIRKKVSIFEHRFSTISISLTRRNALRANRVVGKCWEIRPSRRPGTSTQRYDGRNMLWGWMEAMCSDCFRLVLICRGSGHLCVWRSPAGNHNLQAGV